MPNEDINIKLLSQILKLKTVNFTFLIFLLYFILFLEHKVRG